MSNNNGYVKIYRDLINKGYYADSEYIHLWVHLLLKASFQEKEYLFNGKVQLLKPGQFITGRNALATETGIHRSKIDRVLKFFENEHQIEQQKTNKFRIITITNWDKHQNSEHQIEHPVSIQRASSEHPVSTINKEKKEKKERNIYTSDSIEYGLSEFLFSFIKKRIPEAKTPNFQTWSKHIGLMIRADKRDPEKIKALIEWVQQDAFWQNNILSTQKLREKYEQLVLKMTSTVTQLNSADNLTTQNMKVLQRALQRKGIA